MPRKKKAPTAAQQKAAANARAANAIPDGLKSIELTVQVPIDMVEVIKSQKPCDRGAAWVRGMGGDFPWIELEMLRGYLKTVKNVLGV